MTSLPQYLVCGMAAVILSWAVTGCRLGNYTEKSAPDTISGFYETQPQKLEFTVHLAQGTTNTVEAATNLIPADITNLNFIMTNPVRFQIAKNKTDAIIAAAVEDIGYGVSIDSEFKLTFPQRSAKHDWMDQNFDCIESIWLDAPNGGKLTKMPEYPITVAGSSMTARGRLSIFYRVNIEFKGPGCPDLRQAMFDCYNESHDCDATYQKEMKDKFEPYIHANVMTAEDILFVENMGYEVTYE
ncbi:MAG: hypothetical protein A2603_09055 [Bdellovibrionales bacterium RIFOXYD1_FULL_55_31]|nr:MAG: hypothetical protein A2603_09055 [Bdellovibrionales bacterium RIFOXYD1_FULL_55_31]